MRATKSGVTAALILFATILGCGDSSTTENWKPDNPANRPPSNSAPTATSNSNANGDTAAAKTGVRECDELIDSLANYSENPEDNFAVRAAKGFAMNRIKEQVKQAVADNQGNLGELTKQCQNIKREMERAGSNSQPQER